MTRAVASLIFVLLASACDQGSATSADASEAKQGATQAQAQVQAQPGAADPANPELGQIRANEAIDLGALVNKTPAQIEAVLGQPTDTGTDRISCVRFVPERVFFACEQAVATYAHPTFKQIRVEYEDGKAARVAVIGVPGSGAFDPLAALASVGLSLPGEPRTTSETLAPVDGSEGDRAQIWDWGNSSAKLLVDGLQHRVRVSVVADDWTRSKVEIINNNPLDADQQARIKPVKGEASASSDPASAAP